MNNAIKYYGNSVVGIATFKFDVGELFEPPLSPAFRRGGCNRSVAQMDGE